MKFKKYLFERNKSPINRIEIEKYLNKQKNKYFNKTIKITDIVKLLQSSIKKEIINVNFNKQINKSIGNNIALHGDTVDDEIFITLFYINNDILIDENSWNVISKDFPLTMEHEGIHIEQEINRGYSDSKVFSNKNDKEKYLSDADEIEAYANDISIQLLKTFGKNKSLSYLKTLNMKYLKDMYPLDLYIETFGKNNKITKLLLKKIISIIGEN